MRLDHLIATVPDLRAVHERLLRLGFTEAWPPGPFWPQAITSGIALGGANLELIQPDAGVDKTRIDTLVLSPSSLEAGRTFLQSHGLPFEEREKIEPNPALLMLRGFASDRGPQRICTNLLPDDPPYPFFLCDYAPFLKERLAPAQFPMPHGPIKSLFLRSPDGTPQKLFAGQLGAIGLEVETGPISEVAKIHFADGFLLNAASLTQ